ncbi:DinB family protein [Paenisporosarcina indica]|uniref:DinB family protein n=1 Tax=Paenisporosarcina indica TaxID=650093 RepID=UPI0009502383|nr:DinB family protein [Paenisporosarcina indica]
MYHTIEEFVADWTYESESTQKLLDLLSDDSLGTQVKEGERSLGFLAWHIVISLHEMLSRMGLEFEAPHQDAALPATAKEIADGYRQANQGFTESVRKWSDVKLADENDMYGEMWSNAQTLNMVVKHQIHHRGQLTVLMRQAGLPLVGMYGPSREDWAAYGGEAPE